MNKVTIERFISKYNLSGAAEAVKWLAGEKGLQIHFCSDDKNVVGFITALDAKLDIGEYSIFETAQFRNLLAVLGDDITIQVKKDSNGPYAFQMSDGTVKVLFALSDSSAIPVVPSIKALPTPEITVKIDTKFREAFVRAKAALSDVDEFTVSSDTVAATVMLGHDPDANTHSVSIAVEATQITSPLPTVNFNAKHMKEILVANKEMPECVMTVSSKGLAHLKFENDQFRAEYYLLQKHK